MKSPLPLIALVAICLSLGNPTQAQTIVINWHEEIQGHSQTLKVTYDFGSDSLWLKVYIWDMNEFPNEHFVLQDDLTQLMSGSGTDYILIPHLDELDHGYMAELRLKVPGEVTELAEPRPRTGGGIYSFSPLEYPMLYASDIPYGQLPNWTFMVEARYGHAAPADSVKVVTTIDNTAPGGGFWTQERHITPGHTTTFDIDLSLDEPGHYVMCHTIWYKDAGLSPLWLWTPIALGPDPNITSSCDNGNAIEFDFDFSTGVTPSGSAESSIGIAPNPVIDQVTITGLDTVTSIEIIDVAGRLVQTMSPFDAAMDVPNLIPGAYVLRQGENWVRFVKQ